MLSSLPNLKRRYFERLWRNRNLTVVSYPKSGRTWLRVMLSDLNIYPAFEHYDSKRSQNKDPKTVCSNTEPLHDKKIILLTRDPRDTVVSDFFQASQRESSFDGSIHEFINDPIFGLEKICAFNARLRIKLPSCGGLLVVHYEDMVSDTLKELHRITNFIGPQAISSKKLKKTAEKNTFAKMQKQEIKGKLEKRFQNRFSIRTYKDKSSLKVRKGKVGGFREYLNKEDLSYCEAIMSDYGYDPLKYNQWSFEAYMKSKRQDLL